MTLEPRAAAEKNSSIDDVEEQFLEGDPEEAIPASTSDDIATRAYFYWLERGCPEGNPDEDWFRAEKDSAS